jgi:hypothetical protein
MPLPILVELEHDWLGSAAVAPKAHLPAAPPQGVTLLRAKECEVAVGPMILPPLFRPLASSGCICWALSHVSCQSIDWARGVRSTCCATLSLFSWELERRGFDFHAINMARIDSKEVRVCSAWEIVKRMSKVAGEGLLSSLTSFAVCFGRSP